MQKKHEFSKLLIIGVAALTVAVTVFTCIVIWRTGDTSPLSYLIPSVFGECAAATGFYYSKAKTENRIKLMKAYDMIWGSKVPSNIVKIVTIFS